MSMKVNKYNDFVLDKQFESIIDNILLLVESEGKWLNDNTYVWDLKNNDEEKSPTFEWDLTRSESSKEKLKNFLSKIPKDKIKKYFYKFLEKVNKLPKSIKRGLILSYTGIFLYFLPIGDLLKVEHEDKDKNKINIENIIRDNNEIFKKLMIVSKKSSFEEAQKLVKNFEKGYSSDKKDRGNYVKTKWGKRFVGTNYGISAPVLMEYLGRVPTQEDMKKLSYKEALEIYKKKYWEPQNFRFFNNQSIANLIYDGCVNQGIKAMKDIVRSAYIENGIELGSLENPFQKKWIKEANNLDHEKLFNSIKEGREKRYRESKTFYKHGKGWLERLNSIKYKDIEIKLGI
jgi:lysozyme family protein